MLTISVSSLTGIFIHYFTMMRSASMLLVGALSVNAETFMKEAFDSAWEGRWANSEAREGLGKFVRTAGTHFGDESINMGIQTSEDAKFYGSARQMDKPFSNKDKKFVASFSVKHEQVCFLHHFFFFSSTQQNIIKKKKN